MSYRLTKATRRLGRIWREARYQRHFDTCGDGFNPLGQFVVVNEGRLDVGCNLTVRSFAYQPVQIRVGKQGHLTIGDNVVLNQGARISCTKEIVIGNDCLIADEVLIMDNDWHSVGSAPIRVEPVTINNKVWIATRSIILRGVTLGEGCVVATGSIVTKSVDAFTLVAGSPARPIRKLN